MSNHTRADLAQPQHFTDIVATGFGGRIAGVWRVWQSRDHVVIAAQPVPVEEDLSGGLIAVQRSLIAHLFRLLIAERRLFLRVRPGRQSGRRAIRQIEQERRRLGSELHTGAGQSLAAIRMQLELIGSELESPPPRVQHALERIGSLTESTLQQVRSISKALHPPEWQRLALDDALRQLWENSGIADRFEAVLELDRLTAEPDLEVKVLIYRAMQEALSNLIRHSKATRVTAALRHDTAGRLTLTIRDNGVGFDTEQLLRGRPDVSGGLGIRSIRELAEALGGTLNILSGPAGTELILSVVSAPVGQ
ncbi:MAG TPA: sensor histidine kinase [Candidatus Solibacter sp.]|nr:sensor histidine kinase [Candidatus Solibacter sp.]